MNDAGGDLLPTPDPDSGFLPVDGHVATLDEIYEVFVEQAPHRQRRELIFAALKLYLAAARTFLPAGSALIDGGFVTYKDSPPHDVDVVLVSDEWPTIQATWTDQQYADFQGLLTLQGVIVSGLDARYLPRVQPVGGLLDGFVAAPEKEAQWRAFWTAVRGENGQTMFGVKGYVEVRW